MDFIEYYLDDDDRFDNIIHTYLSKLHREDIKYLTKDDLINLVPKKKHDDVLLMTILVKRYLKLQ